MAVDAMVDFIRATADGREITWPFPFNPEHSFGVNRMEVALRLANQRVHDASERQPQYAGMGTTVVAALVDVDRIVIGHVGDSRAYLLSGGTLRQVTEDHTWLNVIDDGRQDLQNHPLRHVLTNGIGMGADLTPAVVELPLKARDRWLLCSDGVHGVLDDGALRTVMEISEAASAASGAVRRALDAGTTDNATAVVLNVG